MSKDPAFLFYSSDFLTGTMLLSDSQVGKYIRLLCLQHQKGHLSESDFKKLSGRDMSVLVEKFKKDENGLFYNERLDYESSKRNTYVESRRQSRLKTDEDSVRIYLISDNETGYTKIGSSVNPKRRFAEMCNQQNPAITVGATRDYLLIFESKIIERKEELELHEMFKEKRMSGEWFNLSEDNISYIKKTYGETYEHTYDTTYVQRTENENDNSIKDLDIKSKKEGTGEKKGKEEISGFSLFWAAYPKKKSKGEAEKAFIKIKPDNVLLDKILKAIEAQKKSPDWIKDSGQFIPYPATWLNGKRWEDETTIPPEIQKPAKQVELEKFREQHKYDILEGWDKH